MSKRKDESKEEPQDLSTLDVKAFLANYRLEAPALWDIEKASNFLHLSPRTLYNKVSLERKRRGPNPIPTKLVGRRLFFPNQVLILWAKYNLLNKLIARSKRKKKGP